jgi:hypothetical protein
MQDKIKKIIIITIVALSISIIAIYIKTNNSNSLNKTKEKDTINKKQEKKENIIEKDTHKNEELYNKKELLSEFKEFFAQNKEITVEENVKAAYVENVEGGSVKTFNKIIKVSSGENFKSIQSDVASDSEKEININEAKEKIEEFCKKMGFNEIEKYRKNNGEQEDIKSDVIISIFAKKNFLAKDYRLHVRAVYLKNKKNKMTNKLQFAGVSIYESINEKFD